MRLNVPVSCCQHLDSLSKRYTPSALRAAANNGGEIGRPTGVTRLIDHGSIDNPGARKP